MTENSAEDSVSSGTGSDIGPILGFLVLRLWLGIRAVVTGIEKFAGQKASEVAVEVDGEANDYGLTASDSEKVYGFGNYNGVPEALYEQLEAEPLIPGFALKLYDIALGPLLIITGLTLLLGIASRISLFVMGVIYSSLTVGLILLKQDGGIAWLAIHVLLVSVALFYVQYNRCQIFAKKL
ncbi:MAG: hypothetical protein AAGD22_04075 [Verrucomicrobiota bacterium]